MTTRGASRSLPYIKNLVESSMSQGLNNDIAASKSRRVIKIYAGGCWSFLLGVTVNYITRNSLGIIAPELKVSLGITTEQYSWIVGAFQLAYTLFQPLCGWLIDVIGLKLGFMICATLWAVACIAHAGAGSWLHGHPALLYGRCGSRRHAGKRQNYRRMVPEIGTSNRRRLGRRRLLDWRDAGAADYLLRPRLFRLAGRVHVHRRAGAAVGRAVVGALSQP